MKTFKTYIYELELPKNGLEPYRGTDIRSKIKRTGVKIANIMRKPERLNKTLLSNPEIPLGTTLAATTGVVALGNPSFSPVNSLTTAAIGGLTGAVAGKVLKIIDKRRTKDSQNDNK